MPHGIMTPEQLKIQTEISRNQDRTRHPWRKKNNIILKKMKTIILIPLERKIK